jgi:hypothetical protein
MRQSASSSISGPQFEALHHSDRLLLTADEVYCPDHRASPTRGQIEDLLQQTQTVILGWHLPGLRQAAARPDAGTSVPRRPPRTQAQPRRSNRDSSRRPHKPKS